MPEETMRHSSAFEAYYALGDNRSLPKLRQQLIDTLPPEEVVSERTLENWSVSFNWQQRVIDKNKNISALVDQKSTNDSVKKRIKWLAQAEDRISTAFNEDGSPKFTIEDNKSLNEIVKLALTLMGEPERKEIEHVHQHEIKIIEIKESKRED